MPTHTNTPFETRAVLALAAIFSLRMLGLFIILPIFTLYAHQLSGSTPRLMGIALGIYGLTQAIFQIPLAMLSDKWGRKPIIAVGLLVFVAGSIIAALSTSIEGIILGRALQGAGAVGSTVIALVADLTAIENRSKAMAVIGMSIGLSFGVAIVLAPILNQWIGLSGIFWITALSGLLCSILLLFAIPTSPRLIFHRDAEAVPSLLKASLLNGQLFRLNVGILVLHALLTATFLVIPLLLMQTGPWAQQQSWMVYLPGLVFAFIAVIPCIVIAEKFRQIKPLFLSAIFILGLSQLLLWKFHISAMQLAIVLMLFFTAFTFLEAMLPSLISKIAPAESKGTAMGIYSSAQFLGIFLGGSLGGWVYNDYHLSGIICFNLILIGIWLSLSFTMPQPPYLQTLMFSIETLDEIKANKLSQLLKATHGVIEASININDKIAYLKVDKRLLNNMDLIKIKDCLDNL